MSAAKDRPSPARTIVVGRSQQRVNVLVQALSGDGMPAVGVTSLAGLKTALVEFPSVNTIALLYSEDVLAPFECVVMKIDRARYTDYYSLASFVGWETTPPCSVIENQSTTVH